MTTGPRYINPGALQGMAPGCPDGCSCAQCRYDHRQSELYWQVRFHVRQALLAAKDLEWGSGDPVHSVVDAATEIGHELYPPEARPEALAYRKRRLDAALRKQVLERDAYRCQECGTHLDLSVDHIVPEVLGGSDDLENLQTLCGPCNSRKGARVVMSA
jgi:hypothetical protein